MKRRPVAGSTRREQKAATRAALLAAARRCFERQGYAGTVVADIAREAGVAHGTFYVHFASREAAADALLEGFNDTLSRELAPLLADVARPLAGIVAEAARLFLGALDDDRALVRFYAERATSGLPAESLATGINPPALAALTSALVARAGADERRHVDLAAHGLLALWLRVGLRYVLVPGTRRAEAEAVLVELTSGALANLISPSARTRRTTARAR
ncbi:MAG: TetR/AcrR family transcriptional regulator [bacterium]